MHVTGTLYFRVISNLPGVKLASQSNNVLYSTPFHGRHITTVAYTTNLIIKLCTAICGNLPCLYALRNNVTHTTRNSI